MLSLAEQQQIVAGHGDAAAQLLWSRLSSRFEDILALADTRLEVGFELYGSELFEKTSERLFAETDEELADALNYLRVIVAREMATAGKPTVATPQD